MATSIEAAIGGDYLKCVTLAENLRRRHARERGELPTGHAGLVPPRRAA